MVLSSDPISERSLVSDFDCSVPEEQSDRSESSIMNVATESTLAYFLVSNIITQMYIFHYLPELLFWEGMPLKIKDHEHLP